jgi:hypothetical protein
MFDEEDENVPLATLAKRWRLSGQRKSPTENSGLAKRKREPSPPPVSAEGTKRFRAPVLVPEEPMDRSSIEVNSRNPIIRILRWVGGI